MTDQTLPRVLLLGDSIRMSYQPLVAKALCDTANVVGPSENCQYSLYTLSSIDRWLEGLGKPDAVHWNNGLHDVGHNPHRYPVQIPVEMYCENLGFILQRLKASGAEIIWATTTPVHPPEPLAVNDWSWKNEEIDQYNKAALEVMQSWDIPINDLHSVVMSNIDSCLSEDRIHLSEAGQERCAEAVAATVRTCLARLIC